MCINSFTRLFTLGLVALSLAACEKVKKLDEMHDATQDMRQQTKDMKEQMNELGRGAKQGMALMIREELLKSIFNANSQVEKLSKAAKYFMSFEFQIWSGSGADTEHLRQEQAASAAREFMREVQSLIRKEDTAFSPAASPDMIRLLNKKGAASGSTLSPAEVDLLTAYSNLNAMAVAMHVKNDRQEDLLNDRKDVKALTMLSMIEETLQASAKIEAKEKRISDYPKYVAEILSFEPEAKALLQARHAALSAMAMAKISELLDNVDAMDKMMSAAWTVNVEKLGTKGVRDAAQYLSTSLKTRAFLVDLKIEPKANELLSMMWKNAEGTAEMKALHAKVSGGVSPQSLGSDREAALAELMGHIETVKK